MSDLKKQTLKGIAFLGAGKSAGRIISFINTLILARILAPEDYGLMAMAMVVVGFVRFFNDVGFGSAIIQRKSTSQEQLSGVFFLSLLISSTLFVLCYYFAPQAAEFYENDEITSILQVIAVTFIFGAFRSVPEALLVKEMRFKLLSGIEFLSILIQCIVTLLFALWEYKTWSLVWGLIAASLFKTSVTVILCQWLPSLNTNIKGAFSLLRFGLTVTYSRLTWYMYTNAQVLILGKVVGDKQTGIFSMAQTLADLPTAHITNLVIQVASPLFSKLQDNLSGMNHALLKLTAGLSLITFPVLAGMMLTAEELVPILLGEQWYEAVIPMQLLCVMAFFKSIDPLLTQAFISIGKANITARYTTICAVFVPVAVLIGSYWYGVNGAATSLAIIYPLLMLILLVLAKREYQLSILSYVKQLVTPITGCLFMAFAIWGVDVLWSQTEEDTSLYLTFFTKVIIGIVSYSLWIVYIRRDGIELLTGVLVDLGISERRLNMWPFKRGLGVREGIAGEK
ncbi:lipopolysaccharide biosynthesis protein [Thalassotalea fusca]